MTYQRDSILALKVHAIHGNPTFAVEHVATSHYFDESQTKKMINSLVNGGYNVVFVLHHDGWHLLHNSTGFGELDIQEKFPEQELDELLKVHRPL